MVNNNRLSTTPASLRRAHRGMILSSIGTDPGISRSELARSLGLSEMAATRIVRELLAAGLIEEDEPAKNSAGDRKNVGRPKTGLRIVPTGLFAVGITVSAYHSEVSICDASGQICANTRFDTLPFVGVTEAARFYAGALSELVDETDIDAERIVGIGVALSARTNPERHEIVASEYFGWSNDGGRFCDEIRKIIDLPIEIENIADALAIAEMRFGVARNVSEFALVHVATFVGSGIVSENRVVRGVSGMSGSIGHFRSGKTDLSCVCGRHDCLNLTATGFGLLHRAGKLDKQAFDTSRISYYASSLMALLEGSGAAELANEAAQKLAPAVDIIGKLLGPKMIILSGYLGANKSYFDGVKLALQNEFGHDIETSYELVRGSITADRSAALLALHAFCYSDQLDFERFARTSSTESEAYA
jgi:predicted NBD/HSP70 family sugar kinase